MGAFQFPSPAGGATPGSPEAREAMELKNQAGPGSHEGESDCTWLAAGPGGGRP
jgi:hypothetical protein